MLFHALPAAGIILPAFLKLEQQGDSFYLYFSDFNSSGCHFKCIMDTLMENRTTMYGSKQCMVNKMYNMFHVF